VASVAPGAASREARERLRRPHLGIARRREAVEEKRIGGGVEARQLLARIAEDDGEDDAAAVEVQAVVSGKRRRPGIDQRARERRELLERRERRGQVGALEGILLDGHEVQPRRAPRIGAPGIPGGEEIQPDAEAGLEDDERIAIAPALRQVFPPRKTCRACANPPAREW
jgi:hypothetical protein